MNYLKIGFIKKPHGIKGELKVLPLTDNVERFRKLKKVYFLIGNEYIENTIRNIKIASDEIIIKFENYNSIEEVENLRNVYIYIDRKDAVPCGDWEFYSQDIIDCGIYFENELLGKVVDIINSGANDNLVISGKAGEILYPFVREYIKNIDIDGKKIEISQVEGFFD